MDPAYEVFQECAVPERWVAEAIDFSAGGVTYTVIFCGPDAESRAREYADWKNREGSLTAASAA